MKITEEMKLLPCPFCGSPVRSSFQHITNGKDYWDVSCRRYGHSSLVIADSEKEAIDAWNTRTDIAASRADVEADLALQKAALTEYHEKYNAVRLRLAEAETIFNDILGMSFSKIESALHMQNKAREFLDKTTTKEN